MDRAKVSISARFARGDGEFLVSVERTRFLELLLAAHDKVRFFVPVDPRDCFPGFYGQDLRIEVEILNHYLVPFVPRGFLLRLAEGKMRQEQEADGKQDSYGFVFSRDCMHKG